MTLIGSIINKPINVVFYCGPQNFQVTTKMTMEEIDRALQEPQGDFYCLTGNDHLDELVPVRVNKNMVMAIYIYPNLEAPKIESPHGGRMM